MGRPLRFVPSGAVVEVTLRTVHGRFLLRPSPRLNDLVTGVIGLAANLITRTAERRVLHWHTSVRTETPS